MPKTPADLREGQSSMEERLQKVLAKSGLGSRRSCENLIRQRRVTVNGRLATLGMKVDPEADEIRLDGEPVKIGEQVIYVAFNKPIGVLCSLKSQGGRETIRDMVALPQRIFPVGRLDLQSEGLVLLTNDGDLANRMCHPRYGHEKEYRVLLNRRPDQNQLSTWRRGVILPDGYRTLPARVWPENKTGKEAWVRVVMREGRKRQIRETARALGLRVRKLIRLRIGSLKLGELKPGEWRVLDKAESAKLISIVR